MKSTVPCPRHGVSLVAATHAPTAVLHASNKESLGGGANSGSSGDGFSAAAPPPHERALDLHAARYLDLHSNAYLRYFKGHAARLCALSLSPSDDSFVTASVDGAVRFWDLRAPSATGAIDLPPTRVPVGPGGARGGGGGGGSGGGGGVQVLLPAAAPAVAHEEQGMVLAISAGAGTPLRLFDARAVDRGPFSTLPEAAALPPLAAARPSATAAAAGAGAGAPGAPPPLLLSPDPDRLVFSPDGGAIAVAGGGGLLVLDSFKGGVLARLLPGAPPPLAGAEGAEAAASSSSSSSAALTPAWSPCGRYVVSGCSDGAIRAWKVRGRADGGGSGGGGGGRGPMTPAPSATWLGHAEAPGALAWAPRTQMAASGDNSALALWVPGPDSLLDAGRKKEEVEGEEKEGGGGGG